MSKNEQNTTNQILSMIKTLRANLAEYVKETENKIAGLEIAYEALTGEKVPAEAVAKARVRKEPAEKPRRNGRRGMRIDRHANEKTLAFMQERLPKSTTIAMLARKFNITKEAASQRARKLRILGWAEAVSQGEFIPVVPEAKNTNGSAEHVGV